MAEYCSDYFRMVEDNDDSFRMWQGLVGPYYTPQLSNDGTLSFTNNGSLPNPEPVNLRGPQGAGIRIAGIVETTESLPASAAAGDIWLVGEVSPYEGYSYLNGEWIDLGLLTVGPAGPPGPKGDDYELTENDKQEIAEISEALLLAELDETPLGIRYGGTGARDVDGAKENLGIDDIETKLGTWPLGTDAQDVAGAINEMIGNIELQVDDIQKLKDDLAAEFNPNLTYAKGSYCVYGGDLYLCHTAVATPGAWTGDTNWTAVTVGAEMEAVKDIEGDGQLSGFTATDLTGAANELKTALNQLKSDIGIVEDTNTAQHTISQGQYVIWKGSLYTAKSAIPQGTSLSSSNLSAVNDGGLNSLQNESANGYCKMPDGTLIEWGTVTTDSNGAGSASFQNTFYSTPTVIITASGSAITSCISPKLSTTSKTGFTCVAISTSSSTTVPATANALRWMAMGRWK